MAEKDSSRKRIIAIGLVPGLVAAGLFGVMSPSRDNQINGRTPLDCRSGPNGSLTEPHEITAGNPLKLGGSQSLTGLLYPNVEVHSSVFGGIEVESRLIGDPIPQGEESFRINGVNVNSGGTLSFRDDGVIYEITPGKSENPEIVVVDLALTCASSKAA